MHNKSSVLDTLLATEDDAITVINQDKQVIYWNAAATSMYGIEHAAIIDQPIDQFFKSDSLMALHVLSTKQPVKNAYHQPRDDQHVVINAAPIFNDNQQLIGSISIERDVSQIVKLNANLEITAGELHDLRQQVSTHNAESPFAKLKGNSSALDSVIQVARKAARTDATTLILGESGTGKEVCAQAIHAGSPRKDGPFIPVNCGAIPLALFESELFGYMGGAFTGAERQGKAGKIEMAEGGTLFLDEVGELPLEMQVKLLRVLQENVIYRIGDTKGKEVNVRFIAATNQQLQHLMDAKKFRSDLFYRLNIIQLTMPPLRERIDDIPDLAHMFLQQFAAKYGVPVPQLQQEAIQQLQIFPWSGNVRELRNMMERIVILAERSIITKNDLLTYYQETDTPQSAFNETHFEPSTTDQNTFHSLSDEKESMEKQRIIDVLKQTNGNKSAAAKHLGISRVTLYNKLARYEL